MSEPGEWIDIGAADDFKRTPLREAKLGERLVAISYKDGKFGVISNVCNHVGGPLGKGFSKVRWWFARGTSTAFTAARVRASRATRPTRSRATA